MKGMAALHVCVSVRPLSLLSLHWLECIDTSGALSDIFSPVYHLMYTHVYTSNKGLKKKHKSMMDLTEELLAALAGGAYRVEASCHVSGFSRMRGIDRCYS